MFGIYLVSNILVVWDIPLKLLSCTYFSIFFAASAWTEESSKSNTILDLANSACETHISIHAPMKGATEHDISVTSVPLISIRTPTKGATIKSPNSKLFFIISIHAPAKGATAIFHKIINLYCKTSTNTTRINSLNINKKYINRIKARILNYFFGANHLINLCKLYIRTCNL